MNNASICTMNYKMLVDALTPLHGAGEARAMARMVMEERFGLSQTDLMMGRDERLSVSEQDELERMAFRLIAGEPVQHVLGYAEFCGLRLRVTPDVLIPRPETEELVDWIASFPSPTLLDLCTGSGAIAIALAARMPQAHIVAVDVSDAALAVARENVASAGGDVELMQMDVLDTDAAVAALPKADIIVSNPPYVRQSEANDMHPTVLDHEPHLALFVPDDDPLRFYSAIARIAEQTLLPNGNVFVEINSALADATIKVFRNHGFSHVELRQDQFGRDRMLRAYR